jgi:hypothetical protein
MGKTSNALTNGQLTLNGSAQRLLGDTQFSGGVESLMIRNLTGNAVVYFGSQSDVSASTGFPLYATDVVILDITSPRNIYVIGTNGEEVAWAVLG